MADTAVYCVAGADQPSDVRRVERALRERGWTRHAVVRNDTFAVLRAGSDRGWGVAVVCGAGMNCIGVAPDGRTARFDALGVLSGDLAAGGEWVGQRALAEANRGADGRGARTILERTVPAHFGLRTPAAVAREMYRDRLDESRLKELPPLVFEAAGLGDAVARGILDRLADEVVTWVAAAIRRLRMAGTDLDVVLGGGVFRAQDGPFLARIVEGVHAIAPRARVRPLREPPVAGAGLIGLEAIGARPRAAAKLRAGLSESRMRGDGRPPAAAGRR
jgi:N-acetylglucosamine kinase-like BadF-type ATPase